MCTTGRRHAGIWRQSAHSTRSRLRLSPTTPADADPNANADAAAATDTDAAAADEGSAMIEFVGLSVMLLIPFVYLFLSVFSVQRSAFAVTQAAREAGRAYATAPSEVEGEARARLAAQLSFEDQGLDGVPEVRFAPEGADCGAADPGDGSGTLVPGARFTVCIRTVAALPGTGELFAGVADVTVNGQFVVVVDAFLADRSDPL